MCISKLKDGDYNDLCKVLEYLIYLTKMLKKLMVSPIFEMFKDNWIKIPYTS